MGIEEFKGSFKHDGARSSLFEVLITNPVNGVADLDHPFKIRSSSLPATTLNMLTMPYKGREVKIAGSQTYEDWSVTAINDEDFLIRNAMEQWVNAVNSRESNIRQFGTTNMNEYKSTAIISQLNKFDEVIRTYKFIGIFPTSIAGIDVNWEGNEVEEFDITFAYDYWVIDGAARRRFNRKCWTGLKYKKAGKSPAFLFYRASISPSLIKCAAIRPNDP